MTDPLPDIDFHQIRPYGQPPSRAIGFEELASILIEQGAVEWPAGARFVRFGTPDGGREGKGVLRNGDVWAWQAKYLFEFDASAARQVTSSVRRVIESEPTLKRYFVAMPLDLPAGDTGDRASASTRWTEKVAEWEGLAGARGRDVEFVFVGAHALLTALTEPRNAGRARYWFGADVLTPESQKRHLDEVIAKVGPRYTAKLHVEVDAVASVHAAGRDPAYVDRWRHALADLREARHWPWRAPGGLEGVFALLLPACAAALDAVDATLAQAIASASSTADMPATEPVLGDAAVSLRHVDDALHKHALTKDRYFVGDAASLYSEVRRARGAVANAHELSEAVATEAARERALLLTGRAGVGKTHLLCDVASHRIARGIPTILLLGQDFDGRNLLAQIGERAQLGRTLDDVLAALDAAAEAAGCLGLLMIDALNESERPDRWRQDTRAFMAAAARYLNLGVVITCRSEFQEAVVGDLNIPTAEHFGLGEATDVAIRRYTQEYGLEPPTFPVLNPEFSNPLYLKLTCEAFQTLGATRFPFGTAGLTTVCDAFLEAVNLRLAERDRCDYDPRSHAVHRAVREVALLGSGALPRTDVQRVTDAILPDRSWSASLMRGLLSEGVLTELSDGSVTFAYQRLGDVARATAIGENSVDDVKAWLGGLGASYWRESGVLGALAVIVPERHDRELVDVAMDDEGKVRREVVDAFLESLLLRSPTSISERAVAIVDGMLDRRYRSDEIWDRLVRIACVPDHPLNARWLHGRLAPLPIADRDRSWSTWLVGSLDPDEDSAVRRLVEWAWPHSPDDKASVPDDVAKLATMLFGWLLTTSDRLVRDRATKALVSVGDRAPVGFATALTAFRGVNDPYVVERLAASACGVVLRTDDAAHTGRIADALEELVSDIWPTHLLTRDFVRRTEAVARSRGWQGPEHKPPYSAEWPLATRTYDEIEALAGPPAYEFGSVWGSLSGGDFGRYVLQPALRDVVSEDPQDLRHLAERTVFDRVLELGWTPDQFRDIDLGRSGGRDGPVERVGKKYQWIGLYEALGRIADHHAVKPSWGERPGRYEFAEQLVWRDIDPTVLVRKPSQRTSTGRPWFSPAAARFPAEIVDDYPTDMSGVPDPLDLIAVTDPSGEPWLVLVSNPDWEQPLPVEIEALRPPQRDIKLNLAAYLVPTSKVAGIRRWARGKDWAEQEMPDTPDVHNVLLGSHPDDPRWSAADGAVDPWDIRVGGQQLRNLQVCAAWYGGTGTSRDASAEDEPRGYVPSRRLFHVLELNRGVDFSWSDMAGTAVCDPSVSAGGPAALVMRRDLLPRLDSNGLTIFWTALVESTLRRNEFGMPGDEYGWVGASASYILNRDRIELVGAQAARFRPGPRVEIDVSWTPKRGEGDDEPTKRGARRA